MCVYTYIHIYIYIYIYIYIRCATRSTHYTKTQHSTTAENDNHIVTGYITNYYTALHSTVRHWAVVYCKRQGKVQHCATTEH